MITRTAEHALRALLYLGRRENGEAASVARVAGAMGIPSAYLAKLLHTLSGRGWVESRLGRAGGYALAVPLQEITVRELIDMFAGAETGGLCLLGDRPCDPASPCGAHERWSGAKRAAAEAIGQFRLADLLENAPSTRAGDEEAPLNGSHSRRNGEVLQETRE
ncbi:MAG TPA: Rrf2 family transcriptional regulator [Longimicrobiales bacterium]|nr:Rrf2 family transcriptional regulator [Longimicrobiales bacterium]